MTKPRRFRNGDPIPPLARSPEQWRNWVEQQGERSFRGNQIFQWLHGRQMLDPSAMTNLAQCCQALLAKELEGHTPMVEKIHQAADGTRKLLIRMPDGVCVESVLIPTTRDDFVGEMFEETTKTKVTQCISTQAGCGMGCTFCASGATGLRRHLGPDEIVAQVLLGRALLRGDEKLSNVVLMGMGEPLHNYDATLCAIRVMSLDEGLRVSTRRITLSTVGLVPEIERLGREFHGRIGLAVSLHAADDRTRCRLVPTNRRYPLNTLMNALRAYPLPPRGRITIEYALIAGVNDDLATARKLVRLLRGLAVKINLIPLNRVEHSALKPSDEGRTRAFQKVLNDARMTCFIRRRRGDDISAACGQLVGRVGNGNA